MELDFNSLMTALERSVEAGADEAEAYFERTGGVSVKVFKRGVEKFSSSEAMGLGIRVFARGRSGRSYTSDLSDGAVASAARAAVESARISRADPHRSLPEEGLFPERFSGGEDLGEGLGIWGEDLADVPAGGKIGVALDIERLALEYDRRVTGVETAAYSESTGEVALASTRGFKAGYRFSICYGYLVAIAESGGDSQTGFGFTAGRTLGSLDARGAAEEAASMAVDLLGARQVETARVPVLFDNLSTAELVSVLGEALSGESVVKGRSFLAGRLGERIASEPVSMYDDGLIPGGFGSAPFDGEGVATRKKTVIDKGVLASFLHNCYTGSRTGAGTTGNAGRASFRSQVGVSPSNIYIEPGEATPDELRSRMETGFEVRELQGVHIGLSPVTGEVSIGARGVWIERGRPAHAVREVTLAGTLPDILEGITGIGSDLRFTPLLGGIGTPSILVEGLTVGGK